MAYDSLRDFLNKLEEERQLVKIMKPIMPGRELSGVGRAISNLGPTHRPSCLKR